MGYTAAGPTSHRDRASALLHPASGNKSLEPGVIAAAGAGARLRCGPIQPPGRLSTLRQADALSARALRARRNVEGYLLTADEHVEIDRRVHPAAVEEMLLAAGALDKAETAIGHDLLVVPLDTACSYCSRTSDETRGPTERVTYDHSEPG